MIGVGRIGQLVRLAVLTLALVSVSVGCGSPAAPAAATNGAGNAAASGDQSAAVAAGITPQLPNDFKTQLTLGSAPTFGNITVNTVTCTETGSSQSYSCQAHLTVDMTTEGPIYMQAGITATANSDGTYTSHIIQIDQVVS